MNMKITKFEAIGISISVLLMAGALWLTQLEGTLVALESGSTPAATTPVAVDNTNANQSAALANAIVAAAGDDAELDQMIIDDVLIGSGDGVVPGDQVTVHYIGTLPNGQEFDNSRKRGTPFTFTVGQGRVIAGWEEGLKGMQVGGQRILVIPPQMAYGEKGYGPIPGNATLVFAIELLEIN